jgi:hypothetical protein
MQLIKAFNPRNFRNKWFFLFSLTFLWVLIAVLVNPIGEFPLNDDWAYSKNVYDLAVNGILRFNDWPAMTLIAQTLWGALFCKIFGFSFTVLRISVLIAGWAGVITFYLLTRKIVMNEVHAVIYTLILTFNPFYFCLSYTYMTEVPFLACIIGALYFYFRFYRTQGIKYLLLATVLALIATMIRQIGILIAISMILTTLLAGKNKLKQIILQTFLAGFIVIFLFAFAYYLKVNHLLPASYGSLSDLIHSFTLAAFIRNLYFRGSILLFYSGLFLLPLVLYLLPSSYKNVKPAFRWIAAAISALFAIPIIPNLKFILHGNIIHNLGLGPKLVKDAYWGFNRHPVLSQDIMQVIYAVGTLGAVLLMYTLILSLITWKGTLRSTPGGKIKIQILIMMGGYMGFLLLFNSFFDRYFLPVILFFALLLTTSGIKVYRWNLVVSLLLFLCLSFFSVSATHDYLSFNRARWTGLRSLMAKGISPHQIDGGFEFNCWYETGSWKPVILTGKSWWCIDDDTYLLSVGDVCGYKKIATCKYNSFLTFEPDSVLVLQRSDSYRDSTVISCGAEAISESGDHFLTSVDDVKLGDTYTRTDAEAHTGKYAILLDTIHPYGLTITFKDVEPCEKFHVSIWCKYNTEHKAGIVVRASDADLLYVWSYMPQKTEGDWELLEADVPLYLGYSSSEVAVYIWNSGKSKVLFDDLTIMRCRNPVF